MSIYYLDLPITLKLNLGNKIRIYEAFDPYFGVGLWGKIRIAGDAPSSSIDVKWGKVHSGGASYSRTDLGLTFGGGLEFNSYLVGVSCDYGLSNMNPFDNWITIKNRVLKFSVGYRFVK